MRFLYAAIAAFVWMAYSLSFVSNVSADAKYLMLAIVVAGALAGGD